MVWGPIVASSAGLRSQKAGRTRLLRIDENALLVPDRVFGKASTWIDPAIGLAHIQTG